MMGYFRGFRTLLFLMLVMPLAALIVFPWTFITGKVDFLYWAGTGLARWTIWVVGVRVQVAGLENVSPGGTYVFMSNHVSDLDPPILIPHIPGRTSALAKRELFKVPILGRALEMADIVPVERDNRDAAIQSIRRAAEVMRHGIHMTVYPEGTRSADGRLLPFKKGPFHLAVESGFSIVPVTILGTFEMMPKGTYSCKGGTATLVFHAPVDPRDYPDREELMQAVADAIDSSLPPERQKRAAEATSKIKSLITEAQRNELQRKPLKHRGTEERQRKANWGCEAAPEIVADPRRF
jgi:1-acyl-sn-glycerol-3-phosphate acyltransferase